MSISVDTFQDKIIKDLNENKTEVGKDISEMRSEISQFEISILQQMSKHSEHKDHFNRIEGQIVEYTDHVTRAVQDH